MRRTDTAQRIISAAVKYDTAFFIFCDHETSDLSVPRSFSRKKHPRTHLQRPNDVFTDAEASLPGGRLNIELRRTYRRSPHLHGAAFFAFSCCRAKPHGHRRTKCRRTNRAALTWHGKPTAIRRSRHTVCSKLMLSEMRFFRISRYGKRHTDARSAESRSAAKHTEARHSHECRARRFSLISECKLSCRAIRSWQRTGCSGRYTRRLCSR